MGAETGVKFSLSCCGSVLDNGRVGHADWITHADGCEFDARMPGRHVTPGSVMFVRSREGVASAAWVRVDGADYELPCTPEDVAFYESVRPRLPVFGDPLAGIPSWSEVS